MFILFLIVIPFIPIPSSGLLAETRMGLSFREFDKIPNFVDLEYPLGDILRGLTWPIIRLFNFAFLFHPIYIIFSIQSFALIFLLFYNRIHLSLNIFLFLLILSIIAVEAPGYNSYLRYSQPLMTALYLWVMLLPSKNLKFFNKKKLYKG